MQDCSNSSDWRSLHVSEVKYSKISSKYYILGDMNNLFIN